MQRAAIQAARKLLRARRKAAHIALGDGRAPDDKIELPSL
jgi:hypothetical protein